MSSDFRRGDRLRAPANNVHIRIRPAAGWSLDLRALVEYRELLFFLAWRDIKVRYKQTALGAGWAVIQPLMAMVVFSLFFGRLVKIPSDGVPYPLFVYAALVPWTFFANAMHQSSNSLVASAQVLKKVYFPRLAIPIASVLSELVDFVIAAVVLGGMMVFYRVSPTANALFAPFFVVLALVTAMAVGFGLSAVNVRYRDVRYVVPFLVQFWLFATPVAYPSSLVPDGWRTLYGINPMVSVIEGIRWSLLGTAPPAMAMVGVSVGMAFLMFLVGLVYFRRMERHFADIV